MTMLTEEFYYELRLCWEYQFKMAAVFYIDGFWFNFGVSYWDLKKIFQ